jgi:hypothetical protein
VDQAGQLRCRRQGLAKETRHCPSSLHSPCSTPWSRWPSPSSCAPNAEDNFLQGTPTQAAHAFHTLIALASPLGLQVRLNKCSLLRDRHSRGCSDLWRSACQGWTPCRWHPNWPPCLQFTHVDTCVDQACALLTSCTQCHLETRRAGSSSTTTSSVT